VYGTFTLVDEILGFLLQYIPFYFYIKVGFFMWMMLPQTRGALVIYDKLLRPMLQKHKHQIQKFIEDIKGSANELSKEAQK